ncbi:MAG: hypothetical protein IJ652_01325 [Bacteroidales bacterium]|nr:hypothetical protein [Bacteroidales bacterium]
MITDGANGGKQIDLVNHNKAHVAALRKDGARIVGTVNMTQKVHALIHQIERGERKPGFDNLRYF